MLRSSLRVLDQSSRGALGARVARVHSSAVARDDKLKELLGKFSDPKSAFYLAPGEVGPASPEDHTVARPLPGDGSSSPLDELPRPGSTRDRIDPPPHMDPGLDRTRATIHEWFDSNGFDGEGRLEWPVAWGECDMFKHVNNVSYLRYMESTRMRWIESLRADVGEKAADDLVNGRGTSFILKEMSIRYRYPVTYPDSLIWAMKPHSIEQDKSSFKMAAAAWSVKANTLAITADSTIIMYDYDTLKRGKLTDEFRAILERRAHGA